jgi:hypothetical protein
VRHAGGHHHDLAAARFDDLVSGREGDAAFLYQEDLLVGVLVQLRAAAGGASTTINETPVLPWRCPSNS